MGKTRNIVNACVVVSLNCTFENHILENQHGVNRCISFILATDLSNICVLLISFFMLRAKGGANLQEMKTVTYYSMATQDKIGLHAGHLMFVSLEDMLILPKRCRL